MDTYSNLHEEFQSAIRAGDERLRDHIDQEASRLDAAVAAAREAIELALDSADKLELERIKRVEEVNENRHEDLARRTDEGDRALTTHIAGEFARIGKTLEAGEKASTLALDAGEKLEVTRINELRTALTAQIGNVQREIQIAFDAAQAAIAKAEHANEKRFEGVNEFRGELADRWEKTMPREVAEALISGLADRVHNLELDDSKNKGSYQSERRQKDSVEKWHIWAAGGVLSIVLAILIFTANFLTGA